MAARKPVGRLTRARRWLGGDRGQRLTHMAPAGAVFGVAAYQSYWHIVEVAQRGDRGNDHGGAYLLPISIDAMMIVSARYITHSKRTIGKVISFVFFMLSVVATLGANFLAADPNPIARGVAVWPAVALVGTAAVIHWGEMRVRRPARVRANSAAAPKDVKPKLEIVS